MSMASPKPGSVTGGSGEVVERLFSCLREGFSVQFVSLPLTVGFEELATARGEGRLARLMRSLDGSGSLLCLEAHAVSVVRSRVTSAPDRPAGRRHRR